MDRLRLSETIARIINAEDDELMGKILRRTLATDGLIVGVVPDDYSILPEIAL